MDNFKYFALTYLNDWYLWDKPFSERIASSSKDSREALHEAAKYYKITRNFSKLEGEDRLESALNLLKQVRGPITEKNVCKKVISLAKEFENKYGKNAVSAASKFLWLRFRSPIVIFDSRAIAWLRKKGYKVPYTGGYKEYREQWVAAYTDHKQEINEACKSLEKLKDYSLAYDVSLKNVKEIIRTSWFRERIFDKYLWFNSNIN
ncbi:MAG: hypothetical protein SVR94_10095 [Pseudomonadota bacterium]|nr:hypothetical protein [Pseudomonadota bacterium]